MPKQYGYIRVSTKEQNEERQIIALTEAGITSKQLYIDKQSGKDFNRPEYIKLLKKLHRRFIIYKKHRQTWQELQRNSGAMAHFDQRKRRRYLRPRHAAARHKKKQRPHRYIDCLNCPLKNAHD